MSVGGVREGYREMEKDCKLFIDGVHPLSVSDAAGRGLSRELSNTTRQHVAQTRSDDVRFAAAFAP
jgi:hypothetical protein